MQVPPNHYPFIASAVFTYEINTYAVARGTFVFLKCSLPNNCMIRHIRVPFPNARSRVDLTWISFGRKMGIIAHCPEELSWESVLGGIVLICSGREFLRSFEWGDLLF